MPQLPAILSLADGRPLVRASRITFGRSVRVRGVPAVLLGVAAIVFAARAGAALETLARVVPDSLREARGLWLAVRGDPRGMLP